nr:hypothetical protein [Oscillospiraceae bacterium]
MNCMKCGREVESEQVFCDDCLLDMENYPVPPGAAVQIPLRREAYSPRKQTIRRRKLSLEEQVKLLKKRVRILAIALTVTALLLLAALYPAVNFFIRHYHLRPGQNYTTITATTPVDSQPAAAD